MELFIKNYIKKIEYYILNDGPEQCEWLDFTELLNSIYYSYMNGKLSNVDMLTIINEFSEPFSQDTIQGHIYHQPLGYPGDYLIIDKFYRKQINKDHHKWDEYIINIPAAQALNNRKIVMKKTVKENYYGIDITVLNIASGPCRDIIEFYDGNKNAKVQFDCIEFDPKAIEYAKTVLDGYSKNVNFINKNALRFTTDKKYDLVWSGGLFDYFDDNIFVRLLKRYSTFLKENAELVIGNFSPNNPSKAYMEIGNWKLNYRDKNHLLQLAEQAGLDMNNVFVDSEPLGINLFLHYRNKK
jgi:SAM-dependent methyltransferase